MLQNKRKRLFISFTFITTVFMLNQMEAKAWWSCMYPTECFQSSVCAIVDEDNQKNEKTELTKEDYEKIRITSRFKVKFYFGGDNYDKFFGETFY